MKYYIFISLALLLAPFHSHATFCRIDNGNVLEIPIGAVVSIDIKINIDDHQDASMIKLGGYKLECQFENERYYGETDYVHTTDSGFMLGPKFERYTGGLLINGAQYQTPIPINTFITDLPTGAPPPWKNMNTFSFVNLKGQPGESVDIFPGDLIGTVIMKQTNNYDGSSAIWKFRLIAQNRFIVRPSTCTINEGQIIDVNYGMVDINRIGNSSETSGYREKLNLSFRCPDPGLTMPIKIKFKGITTDFSNAYLKMSNKDVGIAMEHNNHVIPLGEGFDSQITDSNGNDDVVFSLIKKPGSLPEAGPTVGSGVLEMTLP